MLQAVGVSSLEQLVEETIPAGIRTEEMTDLPEAISEFEFLRHIQDLADQNEMFRTYIGQGYHGTILPGPIQRNILENPGWYGLHALSGGDRTGTHGGLAELSDDDH